MTMPEDAVVGQEDPASKSENPEETDPVLYFIADGKCEVTVRTNNDLQVEDNDSSFQKIGTLGPGAHFGEISVLYGCKRTATVMSTNYCTLAALTKTKLHQL